MVRNPSRRRALDAMLREQEGRCGICRAPFATDHATPEPAALPKIDRSSDGIVRGTLCPRCKIALSTFQDDVGQLRAAVGYLERVASNTTTTLA
jgi:hypothetical protein